MFIIIKDNNTINKYKLSKDIEYKGIRIYLKNDTYYIDLSNGLYFDDNSKSKVLEITQYNIKLSNVLYNIQIYVYEDDYLNNYSIYENRNFIVANNDSANIVCNDPYLKDYYLACKNGYLQSNFDIIVNHNKYNNEKLKEGDCIEYLGIKIVYFDNFLYISDFNIDVKINKYKLENAIIRYKNEVINETYYIPEDLYELQIDDLKEYEEVKKPNNIDFIKSILPNLIMCLSMGTMAYFNYQNAIKNGGGNVLSYIIMPLSMLISSIILPIIFVVLSKQAYKKEHLDNREKYLSYLYQYENELKGKIEKYITSYNSRYFNLLDCGKRMFYASKNSDEFMKLSIGKISISNKLVLKKYNDDQVNECLCRIEYLSNNIDNFPLYLDINENKYTTIVSKRNDVNYFFNKFLLEIVYKHHYNDINIAIYSNIDTVFDNIYNLPHLFINNIRLTLNSYEQLQELDQMKLDKPLILLMKDKNTYEFKNANIYVLYFSSDINDIYNNSLAIVQYINNNGYLYREYRQSFKYYIEDINFNDYYDYLGKLRKLNNQLDNYKFSNIFSNSIKDNYLNNDHSLKANFAYSNNQLLNFDLHESKHGPHGLIGGSTGSGKSELIISMLLSLCIRYSPEYLNIVLIDYKGGGICDSLSYEGKMIPHIVASISNLEDDSLDRLIIALHNECINRQSLFKKLSNLSNKSIMSLDDYIDNNSYQLNPISHLLIVVDEFAELKKENPEQIKELISISRVGRSLGIHLILATQKPAGVIDDEIWSNSRFKIALKVFDEKDSIDIIKAKDSAHLSNPGSFNLLVDGNLTKGQSIYTKSDVFGKDPYRVSLLDNRLLINKTYKKQYASNVSQSSFYCKEIIHTTNNLKLVINKIEFLPSIPKNRHSLTSSTCITLGEIDDYLNNKKGLLAYSILDSILIYSSRKYEINSILNSLNEAKRYTIVIGNSVYSNKYISDSIQYDNDEDILYLFNKLLINKNNNITLVIEDISTLLSYDEVYLDLITKIIKRGDSLKINIIALTTTTSISFKLIYMFKNRAVINIDDYSDLSAFFATRSKYKGKSFFYRDEPIPFVPIKLEKFILEKSIIPNYIKRIPECILPNINNGEYLIGYDEDSKEPIYSRNFMVISLDESLIEIYSKAYPNIKTHLYDYKLDIQLNSNILWLGSGIYNQRLFISGLKDDIGNNQGVFISKNKTKLVRRLSDV